uniref:Uncharacterized protein n=1 Tax=Lepeophtheirus salmonis TaxID=72036 RepID=A0A0K2VL12_LEPSM
MVRGSHSRGRTLLFLYSKIIGNPLHCIPHSVIYFVETSTGFGIPI